MSQTGTLSGTPSSAGTFGFNVEVRDAAGIATSKAFSLTVQTTLTITTASPLPTAAVNAPYSIQIEASTSDALTWSVISGNLPPGLTLSSGGLLRGTPTSLGSFDFTIQARRTAPDQTATKQFRVDVVSSLVVLSLTNIPGTLDPAQQVVIGMSISTPQPNPITGTLSISFTSNSVVAGNDPFVMFSNGSRTADFTIPANTTAAVFTPAISLQTGTVSGDVVFRADIRSGPTGLLVGSVSIRSTVPKLTSTTAVRTSGGIRIQVTGFSPDRTVITAQFAFDVRTTSGTQRVDLSRTVQSEFDTWFRSSASAPFGSSFVFEQMFTVQGDATMIDTVTVGLTNGQGNGLSTIVRVSAN
jgi:Putative Ig domain